MEQRHSILGSTQCGWAVVNIPSGVTGCEATNFNSIAEQGYAILSLEYDNESMRLYLKNGDYIRVTATALAIQSA